MTKKMAFLGNKTEVMVHVLRTQISLLPKYIKLISRYVFFFLL